ncbi:hypothetical protein D9758_012441 [Tetrapyrgos nigripes]|uniref:Uncharacterized protein n=1 Tax=Tetrapyrgos nigripes TaxID=182062 RepID=A0A8H5D0D5_9AGAR|nr:hypothetical protein D9758_012441 [Tetrapyrgos nigripes]
MYKRRKKTNKPRNTNHRKPRTRHPTTSHLPGSSRHQAADSTSEEEVPSILRIQHNNPTSQSVADLIEDSDDDVPTAGPSMEAFHHLNGRSHREMVDLLVSSTPPVSTTDDNGMLATAIKETSKGLKGKTRSSGSKQQGPSKKSTSTTPAKAPRFNQFKASLAALTRRGLVKTSHDGFGFRKDMQQDELLATYEEHFPDVFAYLETTGETPSFFVCTRNKGEFVIMPDDGDLTGKDVHERSRISREAFIDSVLAIATISPIPKKILNSWKLGDNSQSGDDDSSDSGDEEASGDESCDGGSIEDSDDPNTQALIPIKKRRYHAVSDEEGENAEVESERPTKRHRLTRASARLSTATSLDSDAEPNSTSRQSNNDVIEVDDDDGKSLSEAVPDNTAPDLPDEVNSASEAADDVYRHDPQMEQRSQHVWSSANDWLWSELDL